MKKRMTVAEARRNWAEVLRRAERGEAIEVTRHGEPVAAVVSIDRLRRTEHRDTIADVLSRFRASVRPSDLEGPDPWADVRDRSSGRDVDVGS